MHQPPPSQADPFFDDAFAAMQPHEAAAERSPTPAEVPAGKSDDEDPFVLEEPPVNPADVGVDAVELPAEVDDDGWFDAVSHGATGRALDLTQVADPDAPIGTAGLARDGDLVRPARPPKKGRAPKAPRTKTPRNAEAPKPRRARRTAADADPLLVDLAHAPTPAPKAKAEGPRFGRWVAGGALVAVAVTALTIASHGSTSAPEPRGAPTVVAASAAPTPDPSAEQRADMDAAAARGDYKAAIALAGTLKDSRAAAQYKASAAAILVRRAGQAAERGDLPLARQRLAKAAEHYGATAGAARVKGRNAAIEKARARRATQRAAAKRRAIARRRAAMRAPRRSSSPARATSPSSSVPRTPSAPVAPTPSPSPSRSPTPSSPKSPAPSRAPKSPSHLPPAPAPAPAESPVQ